VKKKLKEEIHLMESKQ